MKMMLWKELRENFKWALLGMLCLLLAEFYSLSSQRQSYDEDYRNLTICASSFLLVTSFGCSVLGIALACVQILPELRRDQWASLLHRPVTRSVIFFGKIIAGLLLFLGATMLPFLASACYAAMPGQFGGPLVPGMLLPGLSDVILGGAFYFGGLLLCLHRAPWFGARGIIASSLVLVFVLHITAGWSVLLTFAAALIYLVAARGVMLSNGTLENRRRLDLAALAIVLLGGSEAILLFVFYGLQFLPRPSGAGQATTDFEITHDNQVFLSTLHGDGSPAELTDMEGKTITDPRYLGNQAGENFCETLPLSWGLSHSFKPLNPAWGTVPRGTWNYAQETNDVMSQQVWYKLVRQNYFIGYDKLSRRPIGIYDSDGYKASDAKPKPFAEPIHYSIIEFRTPHVYWFGTTIYALDFLDRSAVTFDLHGDTIYGALELAGDDGEKPAYLAVALRNHLRVFNFNGALIMDIPYPHDPEIWAYLSVSTCQDRIYLESSPVFPSYYQVVRPLTSAPVYLDEFNLHGNILHTYQHANAQFVPSAPRLDARLSKWTLPLAPACARVAYLRLFPLPEHSLGFYESPSVLAPTTDLDLSDLALPLLLSIGAAVFAFAWMRGVGFSAPKTYRWAFFVFCFGLPGLVALRLTTPWPHRVNCPECGQKRDLKKDICASCQKPWPPVPTTGTEIIEFASR